MINFLDQLDSFIWGPPLLVLLVGTGILLTIRLKLIQLIKLPHALTLIFNLGRLFLTAVYHDAVGAGSHERSRPLYRILHAFFQNQTLDTGNDHEIVGKLRFLSRPDLCAEFLNRRLGLFNLRAKEAVLFHSKGTSA